MKAFAQGDNWFFAMGMAIVAWRFSFGAFI